MQFTEYAMTTGKQTIAVVEDDLALLKAMERLLSAHGYAAKTFSSAEAFLQSGDIAEVDCLVLDIKLDGMSGIELQKKLMEQGKTPPVIFITGRDDESAIGQTIDLGCIAFLHKPFESRSLQSAIHTALRLH